MPKAPSFSPLRLFSPVLLVFCFILFFLPWIELQCVPPKAAMKDVPKEELEKVKKELGFDPTKPMSLISQSGLQIATGNVSPGSDIKKMADKEKKTDKAAGGGGPFDMLEPENMSKKSKEGGTAPLLFLYPVFLLAGIGIAFLPIPSMIRRLVLAGCCAGAFGVIALQMLIGFPIERELKKSADQMKAMGAGMPGAGAPQPGGAKGGKTDAKADTKDEMPFRVSWQIPLYLTFLLLLGAAGTAFLDGGGGAKPRYGRKNRRDDDDEEEDDRPRKKKRRDENYEDEEDERPRKKQKALSLDDDEEDDRPKKKRPRDEEDGDEDDRPRKKKPAEPAFEMPAPLPPPPPPPPAAPAGPNPFAFDDDPPPKKRPRRRDDDDDDDYDDRPRKKRRRDDD